jgi:hypothetical protein
MSTEREKKKIEIGAVIDFCDAKGLKFSKTQIFLFFGVLRQTGSNWFPNSYSSNRRQQNQPKSATPSTLSASHQQSPPVKRENPVRNGGRDRKKLKAMIDSMTGEDDFDESPPPASTPALSQASSSPAAEEPLTPSKRRIAQPRKNLARALVVQSNMNRRLKSRVRILMTMLKSRTRRLPKMQGIQGFARQYGDIQRGGGCESPKWEYRLPFFLLRYFARFSSRNKSSKFRALRRSCKPLSHKR